MKKITIIACLIFGSFTSIISQTLSIGPVVGVNVSRFGKEAEADDVAGLSLGALANYSINEHVGVSAKLLYSQLGAGTTVNSDVYTRLHYLQMPISLVYYFNEGGNKFRPKIYAGPYFGTLLRANNEVKNEMKNVFNKRDIGGQLGLGFNYLVKSRTWLNVDLGYGKSFTDISVSDQNELYNSSFNVNVGLSFPIGSN